MYFSLAESVLVVLTGWSVFFLPSDIRRFFADHLVFAVIFDLVLGCLILYGVGILIGHFIEGNVWWKKFHFLLPGIYLMLTAMAYIATKLGW